MPATIGDTDSAVTPTIASSMSRRPSSIEPWLDSRHALRVQRDRGQVRVAEALGDLDRLGRRLVRPVVVAGGLPLEHDRNEEPALLDALSRPSRSTSR